VIEEARARYVDPEPVPNSREVFSQCEHDPPLRSWRSMPAGDAR
jgi:hypothetical protein